ncbi:MAG: hypothetical protein A2189_06975, partial [Paenibacillus sp. RIFOXYA1_FULL_44_5]
EQAIELESDNASYHYKLSITYGRSGRLSKAIQHAKQAVHLQQNQVHLLHLNNLLALELVQEAEKNIQEGSESSYYMAVSLAAKAAELDPLSTEALLVLALAYAGTQEYNQAMQTLRELLKLDPHHESAQHLLQEYTKLHSYLQS